MSTVPFELGDVQTDDLIEELKRRSSVLIVGIEPIHDHDFKWAQYSQGTGAEVIFLLERVKAMIMHQAMAQAIEEYYENEQSKPEDEEPGKPEEGD